MTIAPPTQVLPASDQRWSVERVRVGSLHTDRGYHDPGRFRQRRVDQMAAAWDEEKAGVIEVSRRVDGTLWILDGQHRVAAARKAGVVYLTARVFEGLALVDEARLYRALNDSVKLTFKHLWTARVFEQEPMALGMIEIARQEGVTLSPNRPTRSPTHCAAVQTAEKLYVAGLLGPTLRIARQAWPQDHKALSSVPLRAIGSMLYVYRLHPRFSTDRLTVQLSTVRVDDFLQLWQSYRQTASASGFSGGIGAWSTERQTALHVYNRHLRQRLPDVTQSHLRQLFVGQNPWLGANKGGDE